MKIIKQSWEFLDIPDGEKILKQIEIAGRTCYKSEDKMEQEHKIGNQYAIWLYSIQLSEKYYMFMINQGASPQLARSVLPNSLKTEIVMTANVREWRHFFNLRCSKAAHPQMRNLAISMLEGFQKTVPIIFDGIKTI